jgi:hypothetical protein
MPTSKPPAKKKAARAVKARRANSRELKRFRDWLALVSSTSPGFRRAQAEAIHALGFAIMREQIREHVSRPIVREVAPAKKRRAK